MVQGKGLSMAKKSQSNNTNVAPVPQQKQSMFLPNLKREATRATEFFSIYANDVQIGISPWDVRLVFGELGDIVQPDEIPAIAVRQLGELRISLELAKKLTMMMAEQLKSYEANVGDIPLLNE